MVAKAKFKSGDVVRHVTTGSIGTVCNVWHKSYNKYFYGYITGKLNVMLTAYEHELIKGR